MTLISSPRPITSASRVPVERAVVERLAGCHPPETYLWVRFDHPDGRAGVHHAWTTGGDGLGDHIDDLAHANGFDALDWLTITGRHERQDVDGRITILSYPLRGVAADVLDHRGADRADRERLLGFLSAYSDATGRTVTVGRWGGIGPSATGAGEWWG